ncbi:MAG: Demethylmenaquinone methyltransferase [Candidatus Magasanikbacteria bacterium GW2011_GWC2_34_16]|uniref:Demethylmenaquinone methyltransferase n=2 Tax=Candidatus Magasanikiibacteriota TaxID=1752731 RepID=A0A0G0HEV7_9BACT|nr:MAG: Demethylmenaquinone methyltransferase [Candidatus Magasanikbacteria bacterium GW2011_GWC2_34_16]KKQ40737.1 MAG: Demethylmenaquinone methyltransferase [Candidatus Magasanikbacteria bacterium GW2011_GWA2_37_8]
MKKIKVLSSSVGYDLAAKDYDKKESYLNSFETDKLLPLLGDLDGKKVLDVGAGTGRLTLKLAKAGAEVVALDVSEEMLKRIMNYESRIKVVIGDAEDLPFPNESFDFVTAAFLVVHLKDLERFFDEVYRVLKPNGKFLVTNINQKEPPEVNTKEGIIKIESYYHRPEKVVEELEKLAFNIEKEEFVKENEVWINQIILASK